MAGELAGSKAPRAIIFASNEPFMVGAHVFGHDGGSEYTVKRGIPSKEALEINEMFFDSMMRASRGKLLFWCEVEPV
jgi:hypothetical protein